MLLPSLGTDDAVGGATSTKINVNTMKLPNRLVAEIQYEVKFCLR